MPIKKKPPPTAAKITKKLIDGIKPPKTGRIVVKDTELKGFRIRVVSSGDVVYLARRRVKGRDTTVMLGLHGEITADEARTRAAKALASMRDGVNPNVEKKRKEACSITLSQLVDDYVRDRRELKPRSVRDIRSHLERTFGSWAKQPIVSINRDKVMTRYLELPGTAQANQSMRILRALMNYAIARYRTPDDEPIILENPVKVLSDARAWRKVRPRNTYVPTEKIGAWWATLDSLRGDPINTMATQASADLTALLLLSGMRWSEAATLTWEQVDLEAKTLRLDDTKSGNPVTLPLSDLAVGILASRPRDVWVFPSRSGNAALTTIRGPLGKIQEATGIRVTPHDLRRTFRAIAQRAGVDFTSTKLLMNHKLSGDVTIQSYTDTENLQWLRPEANAIAEWVEKAAADFNAGNVVEVARLEER